MDRIKIESLAERIELEMQFGQAHDYIQNLIEEVKGTPESISLYFELNEALRILREKKLTSKARKHIAKSNFAIPEKAPGPGSYPVHDIAHARNALARVEQHGTPEEKERVKRKVYSMYPSLKDNIAEQMEIQPPVKRGRGRPRKATADEPTSAGVLRGGKGEEERVKWFDKQVEYLSKMKPSERKGAKLENPVKFMHRVITDLKKFGMTNTKLYKHAVAKLKRSIEYRSTRLKKKGKRIPELYKRVYPEALKWYAELGSEVPETTPEIPEKSVETKEPFMRRIEREEAEEAAAQKKELSSWEKKLWKDYESDPEFQKFSKKKDLELVFDNFRDKTLIPLSDKVKSGELDPAEGLKKFKEKLISTFSKLKIIKVETDATGKQKLSVSPEYKQDIQDFIDSFKEQISSESEPEIPPSQKETPIDELRNFLSTLTSDVVSGKISKDEASKNFKEKLISSLTSSGIGSIQIDPLTQKKKLVPSPEYKEEVDLLLNDFKRNIVNAEVKSPEPEPVQFDPFAELKKRGSGIINAVVKGRMSKNEGLRQFRNTLQDILSKAGIAKLEPTPQGTTKITPAPEHMKNVSDLVSWFKTQLDATGAAMPNASLSFGTKYGTNNPLGLTGFRGSP